MKTPISDFVKQYAASDKSRFHMPGHKGKSFVGCESIDITEINGADILGDASGIIAQSEKNASDLFKSARTFYSTEGSSLSIKAMLALIKKKSAKNERTKILASRNVHKAFVYACALLDLDVEWIYPNDISDLYSYHISAQELRAKLNSLEALPNAFYITSPDYLGNMSDIKGLAEVCHEYNLPLLVDNAHGAYLSFLDESMHPLDLGADMCCDSAHKTLPVLTGGAYLHISKGYDIFSPEEVRAALSLFASTSPSYLILQSLDLCNLYLSSEYGQKLKACITKISHLKNSLTSIGFSCADQREPLKLVFTKDLCGYSGIQLAEHLSKFNIEPEFADDYSLVLMATPELDDRDFDRLLCAFSSLQSITVSCANDFPIVWESPISQMSIRNAILSDSEIIDSEVAQGRICAKPAISFPPAVPIVISGELITQKTIQALSYYGIKKISVVK